MELSLSGPEHEFASLAFRRDKDGKGAGEGDLRQSEGGQLGTPCATKRVHPLLVSQADAEEISKASRDFIRECRMRKDLRHPNIVQLLGMVFKQASRLPVLVMEHQEPVFGASWRTTLRVNSFSVERPLSCIKWPWA